MGQKIHPYGLRLGIVTDWKSRWYSEKEYAAQVNQDHEIRTYLKSQLRRGAVSRIDIERIGTNKVQVDVHTARPGVVIGRGGSEAERLRSGLEKLTDRMVKFNVIEVQNAELDATLLARSVADQLEGRVSFRRAMKRAVATALKAGAEGVRVQAAGRLGGADMGRREWYLEGRVPLHTLRADIDYGQAIAATTVGAIGVQVWVYKGDLLPSVASSREKIAAEARLAAGGPSERRRSAKSRAEAAAGEGGGKRLIEAGGGKRLVEAGGGKRRPSGKRLIEAGGGRRITTSDAQDEFEAAKEEAAEILETPAAKTAAGKPETSGVGPRASGKDLSSDVSESPSGDETTPRPEAEAETPSGSDISESPSGGDTSPRPESESEVSSRADVSGSPEPEAAAAPPETADETPSGSDVSEPETSDVRPQTSEEDLSSDVSESPSGEDASPRPEAEAETPSGSDVSDAPAEEDEPARPETGDEGGVA
jgi:small subunit ribosomal protein S3